MNKNKLIMLLANINFINILIGYELVTTFFLPISNSDGTISTSITIPYRALSLIFNITVIFLPVLFSRFYKNITLMLFFLFWFILFLRIFYDIELSNEFFVRDSSRIWLFIFGIILPSIFSILKSYKFIDFSKSLKITLILSSLIVLFSFLFNDKLFISTEDQTSRIGGNMALSSISYGQFALQTILLIISYWTLNHKKNAFNYLFTIVLFFLSFYLLVRTGSRGPFLSFIIMMFTVFLVNYKSNIYIKIVGFFAFILITLYSDSVLVFLQQISPVLENRLRSTIEDMDTSQREVLFAQAFDAFLDNPIFGSHFAISRGDGSFIYSHNIILDAFMGLGILGGLLFLFIVVKVVIKGFNFLTSKGQYSWLSLLLFQQLLFNMSSGAFYYNQLLSVLIVLILLLPENKVHYN